VYKPEEIVYIDEAGRDNRENYSYRWNERGQRFYDLKSGRRQGRINMIAGFCNGQLLAPFTVEGSCIAILNHNQGYYTIICNT
jgi:hypothetical protein